MVTTQTATISDQELAVSIFAVILNVGVYESNQQNVALQTFDFVHEGMITTLGHSIRSIIHWVRRLKIVLVLEVEV